MTQEEKEILLKDLCARLPYGVKVQTTYINQKTKERSDIGIDTLSTVEISMLIEGYEEHKPYLFPLSSMTEEQKKDLLLTTVGEKGLKLFSVTKDGIISNDKEEQSFANFSVNWINFSNKNVKAYIGWLIKNHFDIHDLIPMGLAVDATGKNIYDR